MLIKSKHIIDHSYWEDEGLHPLILMKRWYMCNVT